MTKAQLSAETDAFIFENTSNLVTATNTNKLFKDIIQFIPNSGSTLGTLAIGNFISGGTPTDVLYTDNYGNLYSDNAFTRDSVTQETNILNTNILSGFTLGTVIGQLGGTPVSINVLIDDNTGYLYANGVGSINSSTDQTSIMIFQNSINGDSVNLLVGDTNGVPYFAIFEDTRNSYGSYNTMGLVWSGFNVNTKFTSLSGTASGLSAITSNQYGSGNTALYLQSNDVIWTWAGADGSNGDVITTDGNGLLSFQPVSGITGGIAIGQLISGGTATQVLYTDDSGNLYSDSGFTRDSTSQLTQIVDTKSLTGISIANIVGINGVPMSANLFIDNIHNYLYGAGVIQTSGMDLNTALLIYQNKNNGDTAEVSVNDNNNGVPQIKLQNYAISANGSQGNIILTTGGTAFNFKANPGGTVSGIQAISSPHYGSGNTEIIIQSNGTSWYWAGIDGLSGSVLTTNGAGLLSFQQVSGITGGITIGEQISGGTTTEILYTDDSGNLFSDYKFTRDSITNQTQILTPNNSGIIVGSTGVTISTSGTTWDWVKHDGSNGQAIITNGSGNLSFGNVGGLAFGDVVSGGSKTEILYIDSLGELFGDSGFTRNPSIKTTQIITNNNTGLLIAASALTLSVSGTNWNWMTHDGTSGQTIITDGSGNLSFANNGISNSITIGENISGGTSAQVLYTDNSGNLFSDSGFTRNSSTKSTQVLTNNGNGIVIGSSAVTISNSGITWNWMKHDGTSGQPIITDGSGNLSFGVANGSINVGSSEIAYGIGGNALSGNPHFLIDGANINLGIGFLPTICGGEENAIIGGHNNTMYGRSYSSAIIGSDGSHMTNGYESVIIGGRNHCSTSVYSSIIGGFSNILSGTSQRSAIIGGQGLTLYNKSDTVYVPKLQVQSSINVSSNSGSTFVSGITGTYLLGIRTVTFTNGIMTNIV